MSHELKEIRKRCLRLSNRAKDGNLQSTFSSVEIMYSLYNDIMDLEKIQKKRMDRDWFVMSKGQSTLGLYSVLVQKGILSEESMVDICQFKSKYSMQADLTKGIPCIENSAGSLGHGLPMAVGIAYANKIKRIQSRVFCLVGDGELNEGTMWESCLFAKSHDLSNLIIIVDDNRSLSRMITHNLWEDIFRTIGIETCRVDGHSVKQLSDAIQSIGEASMTPHMIIASTVRGYGSKTLMEKNEWFHKYPDDQELEELIQEVESF